MVDGPWWMVALQFRKIRRWMGMVDGDGDGGWAMVDGAQRPCMVMVDGEHASVSNLLYNI
jgi:hypothetical protein